MNTNDIERLLQKAPRPIAPEGLVQSLEAGIRLPRESVHREVREQSAWFRRWIPALGFAVWFFGCIIVLGVQSSRITELKRQTQIRDEALEARKQAIEKARQSAAAAAAQMEQLRKDVADVLRLRAEVEQLRSELAELPKLQAENSQLRVALNTKALPPLKPEEDFFAAQKQRAERIACVNHLKQFCLAARIWANDTKSDAMPKDVESLKRYVAGSEKVLSCPSEAKTPYQIISPGASEAHPQTVFVRCLVHDNVGLCDGSVQQLSKAHKLVQQNGEWVITR